MSSTKPLSRNQIEIRVSLMLGSTAPLWCYDTHKEQWFQVRPHHITNVKNGHYPDYIFKLGDKPTSPANSEERRGCAPSNSN